MARQVRWTKFFQDGGKGSALFNCIEKDLPLWAGTGRGNTGKYEAVARKMSELYSLGSDPCHATSVEIKNGAAVTMIKNDAYSAIQNLKAVECICSTFSLTFKVLS
jgi:hypothetical protein